MKRKTSYFARVLSVFLAVVMCLSVAMMDWSSVLPEADAIGTGTHSFKVVTSNYYSRHNGDNAPAVTIRVDGTDRLYSTWDGATATWTSTSFPSNVYVWVRNCRVTATVYCTNNGDTWLMSATAENQAYENSNGTDTNTWDDRTADAWGYRNSTGNPYLASCGIAQGNQSTTANNYGGATKQVYWSAWANDQYGISYGCNVTWSIPTNNSGLWLSTSSGDATYTYVPAAYGAGNQNNTIRACIGGNNRDCNLYVGNNYYYIDLNGNLDGSDAGNISGYGTANVDVKGTRQATNCTDYYTQWPSGSTYSISNSGASSGKTYISGNASGTVGSSNIDVRLVYRTNATIVINPNTGVFNGTTNSTTYTKYYGQTVSIPNPTKTGWTFTGWSKTGSTVGSISGTTFTFNTKTSGQTEYWTATWSRGMTSAFKYATEAKGAASGTINRSQNYTSPTNTYTVKSPSSSEVPATLTKDDKTWTLKGWVTTGSAATWGAASSTATIGLNTNRSESATTDTGSFTYWPVYALTTTKFYANYNYYTDEASTYTTIKKDTTVNGDATTGTMPVPAGSDNGSGAELARYYTKGGIVYELQGWSLTNGGTTVDVPYNSGSATLNVPGAGTPTSTANLTPVELYPVYTRYAVAIKARFHYYTDGGVDTYKEASGMAIEPSLTGEISFPGADQVATSYTKNGRTYTLVGWNLVENSESYDTFGAKAELTKLTNPATDYYTYYPVYKTVTAIRYHYNLALSNYVPDGTHDVYSDTVTDYYVRETAENIGGTSDNINAKYASVPVPAAAELGTTFKKDGVTYELVGWEARTTNNTTDWNTASATFTLGQAENASVPVTSDGTDYDYYPIYKIIKKDVVAQYHYYTASGADDIFNVVFADKAVADTSATVTLAAAANVNTVYESALNDGTVTYTLKGWQQDAASTAYKAFGTTDTVALNNFTATFVPFYPVYETTTTSRYYYYNADGTKTSLTKTTTDLKANNTVPKTTDVEIPETGFASIVLDGRTFRFVGFRKDTTSAAETVTATVENHNIRDAEYIYYAIYQNDELALSYNGTKDGTGVTGAPIPETQYKTQYINAGTGNADVNNASALTFDVNPANVTPVKTGYTYIGWQLDNNCEQETAAFAKTGSTHTIKVNTVMYAVWAINDQQIKYNYWKGFENGDYTTDTNTVKYDDGSRSDTGAARYITTSAKSIDTDTIDHADDIYHYYFTEWVITQGNATLTEIASGTSKQARISRATTDVQVQAQYKGVKHHYVELTVEELAENGIDDTTNRVEPKCNASGYHWVKCTDSGCNHICKQELKPTGHNLSYQGYKAATCVTSGKYAIGYCNDCGILTTDAKYDGDFVYFDFVDGEYVGVESTDGIIPATVHDWIVDTSVGVNGVVAPTCVEQGYTQYICKNDPTHIKKDDFTDPTGHTIDEEDNSVAPTCTEQGYTDQVICTVCNTVLIDKQVIPALGHTVVIDEAVKATCTETGLTEGRHCSVCDKVIVAQKVIAALGHDIKTVTAKEATCTTNGWTAGQRCTRCDYGVSSETIPALGHDVDGVEATVVPSTCSTKGTSTKVCNRCHQDVVEVLPFADHTEETVPALAATCISLGYEEYKVCSVCGVELTKKVIKSYAPHNWVVDEEAVPTTCTTAGKTASYKCSVCDAKIANKTIAALGHKYPSTYTTVAATCTQAGYRERTCVRCGVEKDIKVLPALGHKMTLVVAKDATCVENGNVAYYSCSRCTGVYYVDEDGTATYTEEEAIIDATGHDWVSKIVAPKCTEQGYTLWTCNNCTVSNKTDFTDAVGHHGGTATCIAKAVCEACGKSYGSLAAHSYKETTTPGTCVEKGTLTKECTVCGYTVTKAQKYGDHDYMMEVTTPPTCANKGEMTYVCTLCGDTYTAEIEATGEHVDGDGDGYCDNCNKVIPGSVADHSGVCTKCGKEHGDKVGGLFGYDGFICKLIAFFRNIFG